MKRGEKKLKKSPFIFFFSGHAAAVGVGGNGVGDEGGDTKLLSAPRSHAGQGKYLGEGLRLMGGATIEKWHF